MTLKDYHKVVKTDDREDYLRNLQDVFNTRIHWPTTMVVLQYDTGQSVYKARVPVGPVLVRDNALVLVCDIPNTGNPTELERVQIHVNPQDADRGNWRLVEIFGQKWC